MKSILYEAAKASSEIIFEPGAKINRFNLFGDDSDRELSGIDLSDTEITNSNFLGYDLSSTSFNGAKLDYVDFLEANLRDTDFSDAVLSNIDFTDADLTGADFEDAVIKNSDLHGTRFINTNMTDVRFADCAFNNNTTFKDSRFVRFTRSTFIVEDGLLSKINFDDVQFIEGRFGAEFGGHHYFHNISLRNAKFDDASIGDIEFVNCDLSGADLTNAKHIKYMYFRNTPLYGTKFKGLTMPKTKGHKYNEAIEELESMYDITYVTNATNRKRKR